MASLEGHYEANGARLIQLLIDKGTEAMQILFDSIHPPTTLTATLISWQSFLRKRNPRQMEILFPPGGAPSQSKDFDFTLFFILLHNICDLHPPTSANSWDTKPPTTDTSREANLARIEYYIKKVYNDITTTGVKDTEFHSYWKDISAALVTLGVKELDVQLLKLCPLKENRYLDLIKNWIEEENKSEVILPELNCRSLEAHKQEKKPGKMQENEQTSKFASTFKRITSVRKKKKENRPLAKEDIDSPKSFRHVDRYHSKADFKRSISEGNAAKKIRESRSKFYSFHEETPSSSEVPSGSFESSTINKESISRKISNDKKNKLKGSKAIQWTPSSKKHRAKFEKLVEILKTEPSKATQIEMYRVCLEDEFVIGRGSQGTMVYFGLCKDGTEVAVKTLPHHISKEFGSNEKEILNNSSVRKESHIVNYRYYTEENDSRHAYLVLDLCEETLKEYVKSEEVTMDTLKTNGPKFMREILKGMKALHCGEPAILHKDLKPSNIFLNVEGEIVLADFGISRKLEKEDTTHESLARGTESWIAVECLPREEGQDFSSDDAVSVRYKKQSDIQVAGMIFFYILTKGKHPYGELNHRTYNLSEGKPVNLELLEDYMAKDLISWMLQHDLKLRPSVVECLKHPYLVPTDDQFHLLTRVGNQPEIKSKETSSPVLRQLNAEPLLTKPSWKVKIDADVMKYMKRKRSYTDDVADLLRFIRNLSEHWHDEPPPAVVANLVGTPKDYLLKLFPFLPVVLHRIIRQNSAWRQRDQLKQFF